MVVAVGVNLSVRDTGSVRSPAVIAVEGGPAQLALNSCWDIQLINIACLSRHQNMQSAQPRHTTG